MKHKPDVPLIDHNFRDIAVIEPDPAGSRRLKSGDHPQQGSFAATGRAEKRHQLSLVDAEVNIVYGTELILIFDEDFRQMFDGNTNRHE